MYNVGTYTTINVPAAAITYLSGIDNAGVIVGSYDDTNGFYHSFFITP